jgi:hypothetical protein
MGAALIYGLYCVTNPMLCHVFSGGPYYLEQPPRPTTLGLKYLSNLFGYLEQVTVTEPRGDERHADRESVRSLESWNIDYRDMQCLLQRVSL